MLVLKHLIVLVHIVCLNIELPPIARLQPPAYQRPLRRALGEAFEDVRAPVVPREVEPRRGHLKAAQVDENMVVAEARNVCTGEVREGRRWREGGPSGHRVRRADES